MIRRLTTFVRAALDAHARLSGMLQVAALAPAVLLCLLTAVNVVFVITWFRTELRPVAFVPHLALILMPDSES